MLAAFVSGTIDGVSTDLGGSVDLDYVAHFFLGVCVSPGLFKRQGFLFSCPGEWRVRGCTIARGRMWTNVTV